MFCLFHPLSGVKKHLFRSLATQRGDLSPLSTRYTLTTTTLKDKAAGAAKAEVKGLLGILLFVFWELPATVVTFMFYTLPLSILKIVWWVVRHIVYLLAQLFAEFMDFAISVCIVLLAYWVYVTFIA